MEPALTILNVVYYRNGSGNGQGFYLVNFSYEEGWTTHRMSAVRFSCGNTDPKLQAEYDAEQGLLLAVLNTDYTEPKTGHRPETYLRQIDAAIHLYNEGGMQWPPRKPK